jgi:hypothetical protein
MLSVQVLPQQLRQRLPGQGLAKVPGHRLKLGHRLLIHVGAHAKIWLTGSVAEWSIAPVLKTGNVLRRS